MSRISRFAFAVLILALLAPSATPSRTSDLAPHQASVSVFVADQLHTAVLSKSDRQRVNVAHLKHWALPVSFVNAAPSPLAPLSTHFSQSLVPEPSARHASSRAPPANTSLLS